jgi:hypothetical protein
MDWNTIWTMAQPIVAGQIRTVLAGAAGSLVVAGAIQPGEEASFIKIGTGIVVYAIPAVWSWWKAVGQVKLVAFLAKSKPVAAPGATVGQAVQAAKEAAK